MDGSVVFARQVAPMCTPIYNTCSLDPQESTSQTPSRSVQPFLHSSRQRVPILSNVPPFPPQNRPFARGSGSTFNTWFLGLTPVHNVNGMSIGSAVFAGNRNAGRQHARKFRRQSHWKRCWAACGKSRRHHPQNCPFTGYLDP